MSNSSMPWVKVYTEILDNARVLNLPETAQLRYIQLIILAGECDAEGALVKGNDPLTTDEIARRLRVRRDRLEKELAKIREQTLIYFENNCWFVTKFSERQGRSQSDKREYWKQKQREFRAKAENVNVDSTLSQSNVNAQSREEREESREEKSKRSDASASVHPSAPDPASLPVTDSEPALKKARPRDLLFDAIAEVTDSDPKLQGSRIAKCAKELRKVEATPDQVHQVAAWFTTNDWRGRKGDQLGFTTLIEVWARGVANKPCPPGNGHAQEPAGFRAIREAMNDPRYKEGE